MLFGSMTKTESLFLPLLLDRFDSIAQYYIKEDSSRLWHFDYGKMKMYNFRGVYDSFETTEK